MVHNLLGIRSSFKMFMYGLYLVEHLIRVSRNPHFFLDGFAWTYRGMCLP